MKLSLFVLAGLVLHCSAADITITDVNMLGSGYSQQYCGQWNPFGIPPHSCAPFSFGVPQFDPSLGTLNSVSWSFTDNMGVSGGPDDYYQPLGTTYSYDVLMQDTSPQLGMDASSTQHFDGVRGPQGLDPWIAQLAGYGATLQASGTITGDLSGYTGGIYWFPQFVPYFNIENMTSSTGFVYVFLMQVTDQASLTVDYQYNPVPEPGALFPVLALVLVAMLLIFRGKRSQP